MKLFKRLLSAVIVCMLVVSLVSTAAVSAYVLPVYGGDDFEAEKGDVISYEVYLTADRPFENIQAIVNYDSDELEFVGYKYNSDTNKEVKVSTKDMFPNLSGVVYNVADLGYVKFNSSSIDLFDFTDGGVLVSLEFLAKTNTSSDITMDVRYMTICADTNEAYYSNGEPYITEGIDFEEEVRVFDFAPMVTLSEKSFGYDGEAKTPEVKVVSNGVLLKKDVDYTVAYSDNTEAGTAKAVVTFKGNYKGEIEKNFAIVRGFSVDGKVFEAQCGDKITYTVDVTAAKVFENVQARVKFDDKVLELVNAKYDSTQDKEYVLKAADRIPNLTGVVLNVEDAGFVKFNASNPDRFDFTQGKNLITLEFIVKDSAGCEIALEIQEMTINAEQKQSYFSGSKPVITEGITVTKNAEVSQFAPEIILESNAFVYDGNAKTPQVKVVSNDVLLKKDVDYTVAYADNVNVGTAKAVVTLKGCYEGEIEKNFAIVDAYIDPETNIIVDKNEGKDLKVVEIKTKTDIEEIDFILAGYQVGKVFDITLVSTETGEESQPDEPISIRIPCDDVNGAIYRMEEDGSLTNMNAEYVDGYLVFTTEHLSVYVLAELVAAVNMYVLGDANGDGNVNIKDVTIIQKKIALIETGPLTGIEYVDVNADKAMNIKDATAIQKYAADIVTGYPIGEKLG